MAARVLFALCILVFCPAHGMAAEPDTVLFSPEVLKSAKERIQLRDRALMPAYRHLVEEADRAMEAPAETVIFKPAPPPGGDTHDYWSLAPHWWPDPKLRGGMPYVFHDGLPNPEADSETYDTMRLARMADDALTLALAFYLTGSEEYAGKGTALIWSWCCDSVTRMTPHLEFGHARPGVSHGTHTGIIETRHLVKVIEAARLLEPSAAWSNVVTGKVRDWFTEYTDWLTVSRFGKQEAAARGIHGIWYDAQMVVYALYIGKKNLARSIVGEVVPRRMIHTIARDGTLPHASTRSATFSALEGFFVLAAAGERIGMDLFRLQLPNGVSLKSALDGAESWLAANSKWPHAPGGKYDPFDYTPLFHRAALVYDDPRYTDRLRDLPPEKLRIDRAQLFH